jgi:hypothetical protein
MEDIHHASPVIHFHQYICTIIDHQPSGEARKADRPSRLMPRPPEPVEGPEDSGASRAHP